jgi:beta-phosphoglucomutase
MSAIKAFIFDLDGVITETSEFHFLAWKQLADEEGILFTREDNERLRGVSRRESLLRMLKDKIIPEDIMQAWMQRKNDYYVAYLELITPADCLPGVPQFLDEARQQGIKCAIGSASKNAKSVLEKLQLMDKFNVIGDGYSVVNPKPAPDLFVWAAGGLHVYVNEAVVFEDAEAGIDAAKAAGCYSVGIGTANVHHADLVLDGLANVRVEQVISRLLARRLNLE